MKVLHIAAECYPMAKAGGLGDVAGALPKYLNEAGVPSGVVMPKYGTKWFQQQRPFREIFRQVVRLHDEYVPFIIEQYEGTELGFPLYVVNMPGKFDREGIYNPVSGGNYGDDVRRWLAFQQAVLKWVLWMEDRPTTLHCHDHHTGLIPFMIKHCPEYAELNHLASVFTIHNGAYHGAFSWSNMYLLPWFDAEARGLLDWENAINPLAAAIKCCWSFTTVSPGYLQELMTDSNGMEWLIQHERHKGVGIINGIDTSVWDPKTDPMLKAHLSENNISAFKKANKEALKSHFHINENLPLITFIGRLRREKGADLLPSLISNFLRSGKHAFFIVLGTGDEELHHTFRQMGREFFAFFDTALEYNETLSHQLYAGSDFLLMPSRIEPCGLNQLYSMRYGTIPIVRSVGGLRNTVPDIGEPDGSGRGIRFDHFSLGDAYHALDRAVELYANKPVFEAIRKKIMSVDNSWEYSAQQYVQIYRRFDRTQ